MKYDYIIVGQGLCGSLLSYELMKRGKQCIVYDPHDLPGASVVACGLINPVTGKRFVRSWWYDKLLEKALETYEHLGTLLGSNPIRTHQLYHIFSSEADRSAFCSREDDELHLMDLDMALYPFRAPYGVGRIAPCFSIHTSALLEGWKTELNRQNLMCHEPFDWQQLELTADSVRYKNIEAQKLICCGGASDAHNPFFKNLPFSLNKGEAIVVSLPLTDQQTIIQEKYKLVPLGEGLFWVGSSFEWSFDSARPGEAFRAAVEAWLRNDLHLDFSVVQHGAAIRPSTIDYRPFVGLHPAQSTIGIFNGMGTKGFLLAPLFACHFADFLCQGTPLPPEVNLTRFAKALMRHR